MIIVDAKLLQQYPAISGTIPQLTQLRHTVDWSKLIVSELNTKPKKTVLLTSNLNSLRQRADHLMALLIIEKPTIMFLQETKTDDVEFAKIQFPTQYYVYHSGMQRFNGVAILSLHEPTLVTTELTNCPESQCRFIQVSIANTVYINVYIHQGQLIDSTYYMDKLNFLKTLIAHVTELMKSGFTVILGGDFNIMPTDADLYNPDHPDWATHAMVSHRERQLFQSILDLGFHDIVAEKLPHRPYTRWQHYQSAQDRKNGYRLDYIFTPVLLLSHIQDVKVLTNWRAMDHPSDHAPVRIAITHPF
jgi:exodeoxyribonuclease-3